MSLSQMLFYASSFSIYRKNDTRRYRLFIEWIIVVVGHRWHRVCKIFFFPRGDNLVRFIIRMEIFNLICYIWNDGIATNSEKNYFFKRLLKAFVAAILKSIILITRVFKRKYLHCLWTVRVTSAHRCSVYPYARSFVHSFVRSFIRSFIHLFASDEFVLRCSALMDGPCFRTFYRQLKLIGIVRIVTAGAKTGRSIDPVL